MESLIRQKLEDEVPEAIEEIELDDWKGSSISAQEKLALEALTSLNFLSLSGCGLTSLSNFPTLDALLKLDLSKNLITAGLDNLSECQELLQLSLSDNQIKTIDSLRPLANLTNLLSLELDGNPVVEVEGYREKVFELINSLEILDGLDVEGVEVSIGEGESLSDEDFSPESDDSIEEEDDEESFDSEDFKPKRKRKGGDVEPKPRKQKK